MASKKPMPAVASSTDAKPKRQRQSKAIPEPVVESPNPRNKLSAVPTKGTKNTVKHRQSVKSSAKQGAGQLNARQQQFVDEYLVDLNATQAAIRAGYSAKTANVIASENLSKPNIAAAIQVAREKTASRLEVTRERVLAEYAKLAFVDPRAFYNADGSLKNVPDLDHDTAAALVGFEVDEIHLDKDAPPIGQTKKIKWCDKKAALDSINRMMGWNQDKLKLQGDSEAPIEVKTRVVLVPAKQIAETITQPLNGAND